MLRKLLRYIDLRREVEDFDVIHQEIEKGIAFKGTNLWILMFAIIVASVGLNTNSTAVVIGAMLISPLMGPINGMGYGIATYNFDYFKRAIKNFGFAVSASLVASTLYFALSPVSTAYSELLSRTSPTIYDVIIALFGGLAGIVAISSKLKGNVIPGVAIATALMPPLCTAGYGLASGQFHFFLGAMYLFTINTVFIAISSILVSKLLKFPIRSIVDEAKRKKVNRYITLVIIVTALPSIYFGYTLVQEQKFVENAGLFKNNITFFEGSYLLNSEIEADTKTIRLVYGGNTLSEKSKKEIQEKTKDFNLKEVNLIIEQGFSLNDKPDKTEEEVLRNQLNALNLSLEKNKQLIDSLESRPMMGKQILSEISPMYPAITSCSYSETLVYGNSTKNPINTALIVFTVSADSFSTEDKVSINKWLQARLKRESVTVYFDFKPTKK